MAELTKKRKSKLRSQAKGDCYEAAVQYCSEHGTLIHRSPDSDHKEGLVIVHGEVRGQGPIAGIRYGHAWVEDGEMVIDVSNGRNLRMPKAVYYGLGGVYPDDPPFKPNIHYYTMQEARKQMVRTGIYGPWELETSTGL